MINGNITLLLRKKSDITRWLYTVVTFLSEFQLKSMDLLAWAINSDVMQHGVLIPGMSCDNGDSY